MADKTAKLDQDRAKLVQVATNPTVGDTPRMACSFTIVNNLVTIVKESTQLHPFGGAGSKTPMGRVTGAPSKTLWKAL